MISLLWRWVSRIPARNKCCNRVRALCSCDLELPSVHPPHGSNFSVLITLHLVEDEDSLIAWWKLLKSTFEVHAIH